MTMNIDQKAREDIVKKIDRSYFVEAGAGSGKTTMLVNRMVAMVEGGIDVSQICAITFTKAAAAEFYRRFQELLIERSVAKPDPTKDGFSGNLGEPTEETRERCRKALLDFERCFMGTIDSFCNMLVKEHPVEAKLPSDVRLIDESQLKQLIRREYIKISEGEYKIKNPELLKRYKDVSDYRAEDKFVSIAFTLMEKRNTEFILPEIPADLDSFVAKGKTDLVELVTALGKNPCARWENPKTSLAAWEKLDENAHVICKTWDDTLLNDIKSLAKELGKITINPEFDLFLLGPTVADLFEENIDGRTKKLNRYKMKDSALDHIASALDEYEYAVTMNFVSQCVNLISTKLRGNGLLTYFDYKLYVRDMLKRDAAGDGVLIKHISKRHSYYLLDETQDTDPLQYEIFFYLAAESPKESWKECKPREGALFIVGDPKQSIYRFKGANIASYLDVREGFSGEGQDKLSLTRNFRSNNELKTWFNSVFSKYMPMDSSEQSKFEPIPVDAAEDDTTASFRGVYKYFCGGFDKNTPATEQTFSILAKVISDLVHQSIVQIRERDDEKDEYILREVEFGDIMVITNKKADIPIYISEFVKRGIPYRVEGELDFNNCSALNDVIKVFKAIAMPNDNRQLYAALKSNIFDITDEQIQELRKHGLIISIYNGVPEDKESMIDKKVVEALRLMKTSYLKALGMTPSALFSMIVEDFDVINHTGVDNLEYLYYVLELLRTAEQSGSITTFPDTAIYLENLIAGESKTERSISLKRNQNSVHIANLHKVKGLEAPIVILGAAEAKTWTQSDRTEYAGDEARSWFFRLQEKGVYQPYSITKAFPDKEGDEEKSAEEEFKRLMYVAATRARNALIVGCVKDSDNNYWQYLIDHIKNDLYDTISDKTPYLPIVTLEKTEDLYSLGGAIDLANATEEKKKTYKVILPSKEKKVTSRAEEEEETALAESVATEDEEEILEEVDSIIEETIIVKSEEKVEGGRTNNSSVKASKGDPKVIGTMVHRFMEVMVSSKKKADPNALIDELIENYKDKLTQGVDYRKILTGMSETIMAGGYAKQEPGVPVDILNELIDAEEVYCELPFCYKEEPKPDNVASGHSKVNDVPVIWRGTMDVVYKKGGAWHILDYKTNYENDNLKDQYETQLNAYVKAFKTLTGEDADANVYSIPI